ncbi:MAG: tRNA (adenosine(37)-N6)-threonylcarbamoyltransferase complex transferase subunit TsaD [Bdellovibrionales bacterium]|nr:tRNA (adenosine(37)-N6)-threonylcarbamoyltransferase complex transferase subunit TsaD [Bdellovibrionales bacterium]
MKRVLAIETSCDDTSVSVVEADGRVLSLLSADQDLVHKPFGGIVPEIASRNHTMTLLPLLQKTLEQANLGWSDIDGIVVTARPGLIGSLLVGVITAKTLSLSFDKLLLGVNHLEGHLLAPFLKDDEYAPPENFGYPYVALAVSGGHTQFYLVKGVGQYEVIGRTLDDAAGEAFDKFAKLLGLGFPGGVQVDKLAQQGDASAYQFPRALIHEDTLNTSFSGLKTAAHNQLKKMAPEEIEERKADLCASYQQAIVDALMAKLKKAVKKHKMRRAILTGGVSANSGLRQAAQAWASKAGVELVVPPIRYCTVNAAMIGRAGVLRMNQGERSDQTLSPQARSLESDFISGRSR